MRLWYAEEYLQGASCAWTSTGRNLAGKWEFILSSLSAALAQGANPQPCTEHWLYFSLLLFSPSHLPASRLSSEPAWIMTCQCFLSSAISVVIWFLAILSFARSHHLSFGLSFGLPFHLRPCPHDTFPNRARSITTSSRPVARVHTGATGTLVPVSRDHLATWNERARSVVPCQRCRVDARPGASPLEIIWRDKHTPLRPS